MARPLLSDEQRQARRAQLLAAAHRLYRQRRELPTVADIAQAAGVAKGSVYLSFATKEEIFIALLEDDFRQLVEGLTPRLQSLPRRPAEAASAFAQAYVQQLAQLPDLLPLAAMMNAVLERNLPLELTLGFKKRLAAAVTAAGAMLERQWRLPPGEGAALLLRTWAVTLGLWQAFDCPAPLQACLSDPALAPFNRDFGEELATTVKQLCRGVIAGR